MRSINIHAWLVILIWFSPFSGFAFNSFSPSNKDSLPKTDSLAIEEGFRGFNIGARISVGFSEFGGQNYFSEELNFFAAQRYTADSVMAAATPEDSLLAEKGKVVQNYDPVMVYFPVGVELGYGVFSGMQLFAKLDGFWKEQSAILEISEVHPKGKEKSIRSIRKKFGVLSANISAGIRVQIPRSWIFLDPHSPLFFTYSRIWGLPQTEIYGSSGTAKAKSNLYGIGQEFALGIKLGKFKKISIYSELALYQLEYSANGHWGQLLLQPESAPLEWSFQAIKFNFLFNLPLF